MFVFDNTGDGARLIMKMKMFSKEKQYQSQQSIEEQTNDLVADVFAVYIKHFDRIKLVKMELFQLNQRHTQTHLLSIFRHANHVRTVFRTIKVEGDDRDEFCRQVKAKTLFLLVSVEKSEETNVSMQKVLSVELLIDNMIEQ
ncbi:unnamed protein product [Adineta ricciae]|uniref:Uncharacterized protein n=1 Tax=Adineta ricciae TaxID=249248 RepID=A0A814F1V3_ADIRI|nr:unnamed protein product [Adineta ricciae]